MTAAANPALLPLTDPGGDRPIFDKLLPIVDPEGLPGVEFLEDVQNILRSKQLTNGARVREFEGAAAAYLDVPYCVAVSSCTSGLLLVLQALQLQGEVILPSFTFHATAHAIAWNGLTPVFADCHPETFCLDPDAVRRQLSPKTAAIVAVHIFGNPAPVRELEEIAGEKNIPLIFDAAHAFGSRSNGKPVGGFGTAEVFSFSPTKLVVAGEGGLVTTRDAQLAQKLRAARNYGDSGNYDPEIRGVNARMSELHAAFALRSLQGVGARIARRNEIRRRYERNLNTLPGMAFQQVAAGDLSAFKDLSLLIKEEEFGLSRDSLLAALRRHNVDARKYFSPPVHQQTLYRRLWDGRPLPVTEMIASSVISLPIYSSLSDEAVDKVCGAISMSRQHGKSQGPLKK
jgi:dTDP-4-amino-4,6-dideoxygalactose transaminase